jgi:peptide/nickel transport system substrate-binding protein
MGARLLLVAVLAASLLRGAAPVSAQKYGGTLQAFLPQNPPSLSLHEEATYVVTFTMQPVHSNLVLYDQLAPVESPETIRPELAERWSWSADKKALTFTLRPGVRWHDGKPFTSADVKGTFDIARGMGAQRLRLNPRKTWWAGIEEITTNGDYEVTFRLKRPQPSLLAMLATGYTPVYPAHIPVAEWRTKPVGSGPFKLAEFQRDRFIHLVKNPDYFMPGRPYLDGIRYHIISQKASRVAAFKTRQVDADDPATSTKPDMETLKANTPELVILPNARTGFSCVLFNTKKPPFDDPRLRQAVNLGLDRASFIKSVFQGGAAPGGINLPPPDGAWGLAKEKLDTLPGYGDAEKNREEARAIMRSLGYSRANPFKTQLTVRTFSYYVDGAVWTAGNLKDVWMDIELRQLETAVIYGVFARRDFTLAFHGVGIGADDPDVNFYENYGCNSQRNYSDYCNPEAMRLIDEQSREFDPQRRRQLVQQADEFMVKDVARVILGWRNYYHLMWPYVKNLVPHQTNYSYTRMRDVWLDK